MSCRPPTNPLPYFNEATSLNSVGPPQQLGFSVSLQTLKMTGTSGSCCASRHETMHS